MCKPNIFGRISPFDSIKTTTASKVALDSPVFFSTLSENVTSDGCLPDGVRNGHNKLDTYIHMRLLLTGSHINERVVVFCDEMKKLFWP